jgi:hypothetical protein
LVKIPEDPMDLKGVDSQDPKTPMDPKGVADLKSAGMLKGDNTS